MNSMQTSIQPVRKTLTVNCDPAPAFEVFTREVGSWWPLGQYSIGGEKITEVVWEERVGGRIFERHTDGSEGEWGRVIAWEPPHRFVMSWYPGLAPDEATELEVHFEPDGDGTRVELEHRGWEARGDIAAEVRDSYDNGWVAVLDRYVAKLNG